MSSFVYNPSFLEHFLTDTDNGLARDLEATGEAIAVAAQENVGTQYPPGAVNPAPGPPYRRTGDLQASIRPTPATVFGPTMEVNVVADATHRGFAYPIWLRFQTYQFVDLSSFQE